MFCGAFFMANVPLTPDYAVISAVNVLLFCLPTFWFLKEWLGLRNASIFIAALGIYALSIETVGLLTGFPYGEFSYSEMLGAKFFGVTPWTVAFAWTPLILAAVAVAQRSSNSVLLRVALVTTLLVLFDLTLDPGMVYLKFWHYAAGGNYYGVPATNFAGWILSGAIGAVLSELLLHFFKPRKKVSAELIVSCFFILIFWSSVAFWAMLFAPFIIGIINLSILTIFYLKFSALTKSNAP